MKKIFLSFLLVFVCSFFIFNSYTAYAFDFVDESDYKNNTSTDNDFLLNYLFSNYSFSFDIGTFGLDTFDIFCKYRKTTSAIDYDIAYLAVTHSIVLYNKNSGSVYYSSNNVSETNYIKSINSSFEFIDGYYEGFYTFRSSDFYYSYDLLLQSFSSNYDLSFLFNQDNTDLAVTFLSFFGLDTSDYLDGLGIYGYYDNRYFEQFSSFNRYSDFQNGFVNSYIDNFPISYYSFNISSKNVNTVNPYLTSLDKMRFVQKSKYDPAFMPLDVTNDYYFLYANLDNAYLNYSSLNFYQSTTNFSDENFYFIPYLEFYLVRFDIPDVLSFDERFRKDLKDLEDNFNLDIDFEGNTDDLFELMAYPNHTFFSFDIPEFWRLFESGTNWNDIPTKTWKFNVPKLWDIKILFNNTLYYLEKVPIIKSIINPIYHITENIKLFFDNILFDIFDINDVSDYIGGFIIGILALSIVLRIIL